MATNNLKMVAIGLNYSNKFTKNLLKAPESSSCNFYWLAIFQVVVMIYIYIKT